MMVELEIILSQNKPAAGGPEAIARTWFFLLVFGLEVR